MSSIDASNRLDSAFISGAKSREVTKIDNTQCRFGDSLFLFIAIIISNIIFGPNSAFICTYGKCSKVAANGTFQTNDRDKA